MKSRGFSLLLGAMISLALLLAAILVPMGNEGLFRRGLTQWVDREALGVTEEELAAFSEETMAYLTGKQETWAPAIPREGIPEGFSTHMAKVRAAFLLARKGMIALALFSVLLLNVLLLKGQPHPGAFWLGAGIPAGLTLLVAAFALMDFDRFWYLLHRVLIPDGIFPAGEPIMQLFPEALFASYLQPVGLMLLAGAVLLGLISGWLRRDGKNTVAASREIPTNFNQLQ